jgi:hypothetical protein
VRGARDKSVATVLVVHIDADEGTVAARHAALADELKKAKMAPRAPSEPIALVVPRWETAAPANLPAIAVATEELRRLP